MRSAIFDILPSSVRRSLHKFGEDLSLARRKRKITVAMMTQRLAISKSTYIRVEKGDPTVSLGIYAMALFSLGLGTPFSELVDPGSDQQGLLLDYSSIPKRVRFKKKSNL